MDEIKDPYLSEQKSVSSDGLEYSFVAIPIRVITIVCAYVQLIWEIKNFRKSTSAKKVIENAKEMFQANERSIQDALWKEHCAASLRELVDGHITADFPYVLKCLPKPTNNKGEREEVYIKLQVYKDILNELAHLNKDTALQKAKQLDEYQDMQEIDKENFDKICTDFMFLLHSLFKNCMKRE